MAPLWDAPLVAAAARELEDALEGARLEAVLMDREARNLVLYFRDASLVFRLHPLHGDVALLDATEPARQAVGLKARLREIHVPADERLMMIQLQPSGGAPDPEGLVVELMTNQWNAVWLEVGSRRIRRVLWPRELRERTLAGGDTYRRPEPSSRRGREAPLEVEAWMEILGNEEPGRRRGVLLRTVAFTSSLNARALLGPSLEGDGPEATGALRRGHRLWRRLREVALGDAPAEPHLLAMEKRHQPYPLALPGIDARPTDSLLAAFREASAREEDTGAGEALLPAELLSRLEDAVRAAEGKVVRLGDELEDAPDPAAIRRLGDLILARFGEVGRGAERATLEDFDGEPVTVEMDPALPPDENAERYYDRAARAERARERLPRLIEEARERAGELRDLLARARAGEAAPDELRDVLPEPTGGRKGRKDEGPSLPYRRYRSSGGYEIRVGKGAKSNDELTFHHSSPDDVWMHARQVAGAHVILRWRAEGAPPPRDLAEAANLAALASDARHSGTVPVDWTRRKYVRSPRKSPPGVVVPDRVKTVFVEPDPALEKKLRMK